MINPLEGLKSLASFAKEVNRLDIYQQLLDLMVQVTSVAQENVNLADQIRSLRLQVDGLNEQLRMRSQLMFRLNAYYGSIPSPNDPTKWVEDGPFCSRCFDVTGKPVRMLATRHSDSGIGQIHRCPECDNATAEIRLPAPLRNKPIGL